MSFGKNRASNPPPIIVNPTASAEGQARYNQEAAEKNRALAFLEQQTPTSTVTYSPTGKDIQGIPGYKVTQAYTPDQQALFDQSNLLARQYGDIAQRQLGEVEGTLASPFVTPGEAPTLDAATRAAAKEAILARSEPQLQQRSDALRLRLLNQGLIPGSEAFNTAMLEDARRRNDFLLAADTRAGQEEAQRFEQQNFLYQQGISDALRERQQPLSELGVLTGMGQAAPPQFLSTPGASVAAPNLMEAQYASANQQNQYNQNQYNRDAAYALGGQQGFWDLAGVGAAGAGYGAGWKWSDRRLKTDIHPIGTTKFGCTIYQFRYRNSGVVQIGFMADEIKLDFPEFVMRIGDYDAVNYTGVLSHG